jgi:hypothetical protein
MKRKRATKCPWTAKGRLQHRNPAASLGTRMTCMHCCLVLRRFTGPKTDRTDGAAQLTDQPERAQPAWSVPFGAVARARLSWSFGDLVPTLLYSQQIGRGMR